MNLQRSIKKRLSATLCIALLFCSPLFAASSMPSDHSIIVTSQLGKLKGKVSHDVTTFHDIPYAKNPFNDTRRFQAPQAIDAWTGVLDATMSKSAVPQPSRGRTTTLFGAPGDLSVNIWTPTSALTAKHKLPVMVWLPGGAFIRGDAGEASYDGTSFAKHGVVLVTVNYRVGVDGFMHLEGAPDNRGILDQLLALQWVQDNISAFGGDAQQVTLFGQSAGAESVAILLGTEKANGLYHRAIMQSPPMQAMTQAQASRVARAFAEKSNVTATVKGISSIPYPQLVATVVDMGRDLTHRDDWGMLSWGGTAFLPVIDKDLIKSTPMVNLANNANPAIPVIVGSTDQEARLYLVPTGEIDRISAEKVSLLLHDLALTGDPLAVYAQGKTQGEHYADIQSDFTFRMPALHIAEALTNKGSNVWKYNFAWQSQGFNGRLGAAHFVDVPYAFNTIHKPEVAGFMGKKPSEALAQEMHRQWVTFAKSGRADWMPYRQDVRATMRFDVHSQQVNNPNQALRAAWEAYRF